MLFTEIAGRAGLPAPVVAELLYPGAPAIVAGGAPQCGERDLLRAQIAAGMLSAGVRWSLVQDAVGELPDNLDDLARTRAAWETYQPGPVVAAPLVTALLVLALLIGIALGRLW